MVTLLITKFEDIYNKMIPLFKKFKIIGVKTSYFQDFRLVAELIVKKIHLTKKDLQEIYLKVNNK